MSALVQVDNLSVHFHVGRQWGGDCPEEDAR